ncbi:MAG TPA: hypothetical protein VIW29_12730, partial [Polyangiaceae bacterium]
MKARLACVVGCWLLACERAESQPPTQPPTPPVRAHAASEPVVGPSAAVALPSAAPSSAGPPSPQAADARPAESAELGTSSAIVLAAGGDVNFGRECGQAILKDATYAPFARLGAGWTAADARFA